MSDLPSPTIYTTESLSVELLETSPNKYFDILDNLSSCKDESSYLTGLLKEKLNEKPYRSWHSNHAFCVALLVGKMNDEVIDKHSYDYYGNKLPNGLDEDFAISLIDKIIECGGNILDKNYYQESIIEIYKGRFYRTGNEKFKEYVKQLYEKYTIINCSL